MVKRIRYQESRSSRSRRTEPRDRWIFEPFDAVLAAVALFVILWLQWLTAGLPV